MLDGHWSYPSNTPSVVSCTKLIKDTNKTLSFKSHFISLTNISLTKKHGSIPLKTKQFHVGMAQWCIINLKTKKQRSCATAFVILLYNSYKKFCNRTCDYYVCISLVISDPINMFVYKQLTKVLIHGFIPSFSNRIQAKTRQMKEHQLVFLSFFICNYIQIKCRQLTYFNVK